MDNICSQCDSMYSNEELGLDSDLSIDDWKEELNDVECPNCGEVGKWHGASDY